MLLLKNVRLILQLNQKQPEDNPEVYAPFAGQEVKQQSSQEQNVNQDNDITSEVTG